MGIYILTNEPQFKNADAPIDVTLEGIVTVFKFIQPENTDAPTTETQF
jgi:hypothetical protein